VNVLRLINIENVTADMSLAKPIYQQTGSNILLNNGCTNLPAYRDKLIKLGIHYIYVEDSCSKGIEINDVISENTRIKSRKIIYDVMYNVMKGKNINMRQVNSAVENMMQDILQNEEILISLSDIRTNDEYTFGHSVNVAVLALVLGKALHYNKYKLKKLGVGALLHDLGKIKIPPEILNKPGKLTPEEFHIIEEHTKLGFDTVKSDWGISPLSRTVILAHHEKMDGTGYPRGVKGEDIHEFARIVAICDVFDALSANRCYSPKWPIEQVVAYLVENSGSQFDENLVNIFIKNVASYPNGSKVLLSDGRRGIVFAQNNDAPTKPFVRILEDSGKRFSEEKYYTVDLLEEKELSITSSE
jgi:HD-GYP domain-containing protein (c-di-GMP phosphodiesterase class II)